MEQDPTEPPSIICGHSSLALPKASKLLGHEWSSLALLQIQEWQGSRKLPLSSKWVQRSKSSYRVRAPGFANTWDPSGLRCSSENVSAFRMFK